MAGARGEFILPSLPSLCTFLPPVISGGLAQGYHMLVFSLGRLHVGFPEFTRFFTHRFPGEAAERHSRLLYQLSYRGMLRL